MNFQFELNGLKLIFDFKDKKTSIKTVIEKYSKIEFRLREKDHTFSLGFKKSSKNKKSNTLSLAISVGFLESWKKGQDKIFIKTILMDYLFKELLKIYLMPTFNFSYYLPAARSGILSGHKALASGLLRQLRYIGFEKMEFFPLSGTITDFLANLLQIEKVKGDFGELAKFIEDEIAEGKIDIKETERFTYPEIYYEFDNKELPLHRSSSMVSELAPLILFLKYIITPKSTLIIEEPESHLHPSAQRKLATLLIRLVKREVRTILTSHSDYFLHQVQNLSLISDLKSDALKKLNYTEQDQVESEKLGVYLFARTKNRRTQIKPVNICDTSLKDSGFNDVVEELYGETVKIDRELQKLTR